MSHSESFTIGFGDSTRNSSRVLNPPGGISSDIFGTNSLAHGPPRGRNMSHLQSSFSMGATGIPNGGVYDIFPEKTVKSPLTGGRQARSEVFADRGKAEEESTGTAANPVRKTKEEEEEELMNDKQGNVKEQGNEVEGNELRANEQRRTSGEPGNMQQGVFQPEGGPNAHVQLPRAGSRNPITGFGIGLDDTREISSSGGDTANQNHFLAANTGKRMFNRYNQRSQQW